MRTRLRRMSPAHSHHLPQRELAVRAFADAQDVSQCLIFVHRSPPLQGESEHGKGVRVRRFPRSGALGAEGMGVLE